MKRTSIILSFILFQGFNSFAQYKLYEEGLAKYNEKEYYEAISLLSDFLTKPQHDKKFDKDAYYWRGLASYKLNNFAEAGEDLKKALELNYSNKGNLHWFLAKCYDKMERKNEALVEYGNALRFLSSDKVKEAQILFDRSQVYTHIGKLNEAQQDLQIASAVDPENTVYKEELTKLSAERSRSTAVDKNTPAKTTPVQNTSQKPLTKPTEQKKQPIESTSQPTQSKSVETTVAGVPLQKAVTKPVVKEPASIQPAITQPIVAAPAEPTLADIYADEKRYALVIGNAAYTKKVGVLKNSVNDATDFAASLKQANFDVTLIVDASYGKIRAEMMKFRDKLNQGEKDKTVGLFFYAGHGLQHDNENYIVPVDAELEFEDDISRYCFPIQRMVLAQMEQSNSRMNIVVLDACRNNPFPALHRGIGESSGLGEMKKARGAFIAYATSPGSVASDGTSRNGLYTQELIKAMSKPGKTIEQVFKEVRGNVLRQSGDKQNPWENSNITGDFYFKF